MGHRGVTVEVGGIRGGGVKDRGLCEGEMGACNLVRLREPIVDALVVSDKNLRLQKEGVEEHRTINYNSITFNMRS